MNVEQIQMQEVELALKVPFRTHQGTVHSRKLIIVKAIDREGRVGYGEVTAFETPFYTAETNDTAWYLIKEILLPSLDLPSILHPEDFANAVSSIQGHPMAKAGVEGALWDLFAKQSGKSLKNLIGGTRETVKAGAVLSLSSSLEQDIKQLKQEGYQRFKLKVKKGEERELIEAVQAIDPELPIMIDANGQYTEADIEHVQSLDDANLLMIEQPFRAGDFYLHRSLQAKMVTPICLDESIMSAEDAIQAIRLKSGSIINIKISRVGGLSAALRIHDYCKQHNVPVWCGGMVESGISKAHNIALASLEQFTIPGDLSGSSRYFEKDLVSPLLEVVNGEMIVPQGDGIGVNVDEEYMEKQTIRSFTFEVYS
ncbi:o-succinylbenzoate synthase [Halobacillus salinus]|uniref:o-succinylbenzoate synthase n=1 Tax=Halobacillus salinus TaxID=192814 RepID=A0A4Z0GWG9_9BACI|nr:o-succinylbenzoate synthase [Halobacillus salinus]TGB02159.1 o-succinylbenzoate synthase [Halobacillus salinus]